MIRLTRIGFLHANLPASIVGMFEIACGFLVVPGFRTTAAAVSVPIVISTAIATTKIQPILLRSETCPAISGTAWRRPVRWEIISGLELYFWRSEPGPRPELQEAT